REEPARLLGGALAGRDEPDVLVRPRGRVEDDRPEPVYFVREHRIAHVDDAVRRIVLDGDEVTRDAGEPLDVTRLLALRVEPREVAAKIELLDALAVDHGRSHAGAHRIDVVAAVVLVDHFPEQQVTERRLRLEPDRLMPAS